MRIQRHPDGTRVHIKRGRLPIDPSTLGRVGVIVQRDERTSDKYAVQLDGESELRIFAEDELGLEPEDGGTEPGVSPPGGSETPS